MVITDPNYIDWVPDEARSSYAHIKAIIDSCMSNASESYTDTLYIYKNISDTLKSNIDIIEMIYKYGDGFNLHEIAHEIPECVFNDRDILCGRLSKYLNFIYPVLNNEYKHDRDILMAALNADNIYYEQSEIEYDSHTLLKSISIAMLAKKLLVLEIIEICASEIYRYLPDHMRSNIEIINSVFKYRSRNDNEGDRYENILPFIPEKLMNDKKFVMYIIKEYTTRIYSYLTDDLKTDVDIILSAGICECSVRNDIPFDKMPDSDIIYICDKCPSIYNILPLHIRDIDHLALKAIKYSEFYNKYISERLKNDLNFTIEKIKICPILYTGLSPIFKMNKDIITICLENMNPNIVAAFPTETLVKYAKKILLIDGKYMEYMPDNIKRNNIIALLAINSNIIAYKYIDRILQCTPNIVKSLLAKDFKGVDYIPSDIMNKPNIHKIVSDYAEINR